MLQRVCLTVVLLFSLMQVTPAERRIETLEFSSPINQEPELTGPSKLCNFFGTVLGSFSAGGDPSQDRYSWLVTDAIGNVIFDRSGGATFETVNVNFGVIGIFRVQVVVTRQGAEIYNNTQSVEVIQGPQLILERDYLLCGESPAVLTALSPNTPNIDNYTIEWRNQFGQVVGGGQNQWETRIEGEYFVTVFLNNPNGDPDCVIEGATFVGPLDDFELIASDTELCENQSLEIRPDNPLRGQWFYRKQGSPTKVSIETSSLLELDGERDLDGPGIYEIIFEVTNPRNPGCISSRSVSIVVNESPSYDFEISLAASACDGSDGEIIFQALNYIDVVRIVEIGWQETNIPSNTSVLISNLAPGVYTVEAEIAGCFRTSIAIVPLDENEVENLLQVSASGEVCTASGIGDGAIQVDFTGAPISGIYRLYNAIGGELIDEQAIPSQTSFSIDLPWGFYAIEFIDDFGCIFPWGSVLEISRRNRVNFSVPSTLTICEDFDFFPITSQTLEFELLFPNGTRQTRVSGQAFQISEPGEYVIFAKESGTSDPVNCPLSRGFRVVRTSPLDFEPEIIGEDCFGNIFYQVNLFGRDPDDVVIRWFDKEDRIVGRGIDWIPTAFDEFRLEVQLRGSNACIPDPKFFTVEPPVFGLDLEFESAPFCPDIPQTTLTLITDFSKVDKIEWLLIRADGSETLLADFNGPDVQVEEDGFYEAVVFRELFNGDLCEIGREQFLMIRSTDDSRPLVAPFYTICKDINLSETINPGVFEEYQWFREGSLISTSSTYRPLQAGNYSLVVKNPDDCQYVEEFTVFEECEFQFMMPTGMVIGDPDRQFEIYVNDAVEEARLWIHNRLGQLIFYCEGVNVQSRVAFCQWDGTLNGSAVPTDQYIVTLSYVSERFGVNQKISQSLMVINN